MSLAPGSRLGPYEIAAPLGAGGMGEVYRAQDTRLGRTVAIKILPSHLAAKPEAKQRFEREARTISALQHPRICTLHDVGHQDGTDFLVMEYLEGETLAHRLAKGPLPPQDVLEIGIETCEGLEAAHRAGVAHRDLKPANVMLTKTGAKLLDFGLAKPLDAPPAANLSVLPTVSQAPKRDAQPLTAEGTIIGTFQYMAPEQLEGQEADARSDIFALGALLYEMATGKRAFEGKSQASVIAAILEREPPPVSQLQPASPPALDRVVRQCLAKDPDERWQSAHDVKLELEGIRDAGSSSDAASAVAARKFGQRAAWAMAAIGFLAAIVFGTAYFLRAPRPLPMVRSSLLPPASWSFKSFNFAVSPDGTRLAFVATNAEGKNALWVRSLSAASPHQLDGTGGAIYPFWSPDNRRIGFFADSKLKTVDIVSGSVRILCDAHAGRGGTWNREGTIVFAPEIDGSLYAIPDTGGVPTAVTGIPNAGPQAHRWPFFLPDGRHFLYFVDWTGHSQQSGIYAGSLDAGASKLVSSQVAGSVAFASGYLLYVHQTSLMAQPFDPGSLETKGPPEALAEQEVPMDTSFSRAGFSVSENGVLIFQSLADSASQLEWFDAKGNPLGKVHGLGYADPSISPDGRFLAVTSDDERNGKHYIRVLDLSRGTSTRLTDGGMETTPSWSTDGKWIFYNISSRGAGNSSGISRVAADGSGRPQFLLQRQRLAFGSWSPDGHFVITDFSGGGGPSLAVYSASTKRITELGQRGAEPRFSPDGRWIAYTASEIFVQSFPRPGPRVQISNSGGAQPVWSRDGRHVFYISRDKKMMEVDFDPKSGTAGAPRVVFQTRIVSPSYVGTQYDVAPDGRFIVNSLPADHAAPFTLLANWTAALKQK